MKKTIFVLLIILSASSCKIAVENPPKTTTKNFLWIKEKTPPQNLKAIAKCYLECNNGTSIKGKAVIRIANNTATIKLYTSAGIYAGKISILPDGIYASENIAPFATYIRSVKQIESALTGYIYDKNYKILSPQLIELPFGSIRELYFYKDGSFDKVVIENNRCQLTIKPIKVKEAKR